MKKILTMLLALLLIIGMAVPAHAATPRAEVPDMPDVSKIEFDFTIKLPSDFWSRWFDEHPVVLPVNWKPAEKTAGNEAMTEALQKWTQ